MPLRAKFATSCGVCSRPIEVGEQITGTGAGPSRRWAHVGCAQGTFELGIPDGGGAGATSSPPALEVWTDGACSGNPGPGGWAWATRDGRQDCGGALRTTNQRMEIQAALEAVTALTGPLVVVSDSTYVVNCFKNSWWKGWLANGWKTSAKKPVVSRDLWEPLITAVNARGNITFRWVKGHSGDEMNDLVDKLAVEASQAQLRS
jgi:ribonuclease HI